jgi:TonB family protein
MKPAFTILSAILLLNTALAQNAVKTYFLAKSGKIVSTKDSAEYLLQILPPDTSVDKNLVIVKEFYKSGKIHWEASSTVNTYPLKLQGNFTAFFADGKKMVFKKYDNGVPVGDEMDYYPNGNLYGTKTYVNGKPIIIEIRDSTGKVLVDKGNGRGIKYLDERYRKNYMEGPVVGGFQEGEWQVKVNDTLKTLEEYKKGEVIASSFFDESGNRNYTAVEKIPEFPGGVAAFGEFLSRNIVYPQRARRKGTQGRVIITFIAGDDGKLTDIKVVKGIGDGCDEEAVRVIKLCPLWKPGIVQGKPVRTAYAVPIMFALKN